MALHLIDSDIHMFDIAYSTPEMYGAKGNGITDDSTAIQLAVNSGMAVYFSSKNYVVKTTINLPNNSVIVGNKTIISTTDNITVFSIKGSNINISNLIIQGNGVGINQNGIAAIAPDTLLTTQYILNRINNCKFQNLGGSGIYGYYIVGPNFEGIFSVNSCIATGCGVGFWMDDRAEYNNFINCIAVANIIGVRIKGGNNGWVGGQIVGNTTNGIEILGGANDGHGYVSACKINHNGLNTIASSTYNIYILGVTKNFIFNCCEIYVGRVNVSGAVIKFNACEFSTFARANLNTSTTEFRNCTFYTALDTTNFVKTTGNAPIGSNNIFVAGNTSLWLQNFGTATLASGTITIANESVTATTKIKLTPTSNLNLGSLYVTKNANVGFSITSTNVADASTIDWELTQL